MKDEHETKEHLINELVEMRQRVAELEAADTERKRAEEKLKEYSEQLEEMVEERTRELRDAQERLIRQEKLSVLGQMAASVSHELRRVLRADHVL